MKEYLNKLKDGTYKLVVLSDVVDGHDGLIEIPEGAEKATFCGGFLIFWKDEFLSYSARADSDWKSSKSHPEIYYSFTGYTDVHSDAVLIWKRETLSDQVASAETARQSEKVLKEILEGGLNQKTVDAMKEADAIIDLRVDQDNVNQPSHYNKGRVECIDAIQSSMTREAFCGYLKGNVQKYMWRYENKGGVESLKKAQWYLNKLIEVQNGNS